MAQTLVVETFSDLFSRAEGETKAVIECALNRIVVHQLKLDPSGTAILLDAMSGPIVKVGLDEPITYEPWCCDRGSLLFNARQIKLPDAKLATELDELCYPDGRRFTLVPKGRE